MFEFVDMYFVKYHALTFNLFLTNEVDNTGFVRVFSLGYTESAWILYVTSRYLGWRGAK